MYKRPSDVFFVTKKVEGEKENMETKIMDAYNMIVGFFIAILTMIFGEHWFIFAAFLLLNVIDWLTGWMKARINKKENSVKGWRGVLKKLGYWLMILVAFLSSAVFVEIGKTLNVDLAVTALLGYFVIASLIVNEIRSILENFVEAGFDVPVILVKGLEVADRVVNQTDQEETEQ